MVAQKVAQYDSFFKGAQKEAKNGSSKMVPQKVAQKVCTKW